MLKLQKVEGLATQPLMDLVDEMNTQIRNMCFSPAGLAIGSGATEKVLIANTVVFTFDGVFKSKSTAEVAFTATTHDIAPNADSIQEACYLMTLAVDGTPTLTMGAIATGSGAALLPERPATGTPIGYVRIAVAAGATLFNASTDALSAGHLTDTYVDLSFLGARFDATQ